MYLQRAVASVWAGLGGGGRVGRLTRHTAGGGLVGAAGSGGSSIGGLRQDHTPLGWACARPTQRDRALPSAVQHRRARPNPSARYVAASWFKLALLVTDLSGRQLATRSAAK